MHRTEPPPKHPLPLLRLLSISTIGLTVEYCWSSNEAVLIPHLTRHGVSHSIVSLIYVCNPALGVWIQPSLGKWSDALNRRGVFVLGLCVIGIGGILLLMCASSVGRQSGESESADDGTFGVGVVLLSFVAFGVADICYDCLLIPGRAMVDDVSVPIGRGEDANALFTAFQLTGRLIGLLVVSSNMTNSGFWGLFDDSSGEDGHFNAVLSTCVVCLGSTAILVGCLNDVGSSAERVLCDTVSNRDDKIDEYDNEASSETDDFISNYRDGLSYNGDDNCFHDEDGTSHPVVAPSNNSKYQPLSIECENDDNQPNQQVHSLPLRSAIQSICRPVDATALLVLVQSVGWVGITAQSFFWTSWRGEQTGSIDLAFQGAVGIVTSALLPILNRHVGAATVWLASELFFHMLMMSVAFVGVDDYIARVISALCGINYAIHATNALIVAADVVADPSKRARTIAMVNNALPYGQLVTALFGGVTAQYFGGFRNVLVCFGWAGCVVTGAVWIVVVRRGLFCSSSVN